MAKAGKREPTRRDLERRVKALEQQSERQQQQIATICTAVLMAGATLTAAGAARCTQAEASTGRK